MKYRAFGIEMRHVAVDVEADNFEDAAKKAYQMFGKGEAEDSHSDEPWYDEDVEVAPYEEDDWRQEKAEIHPGK